MNLDRLEQPGPPVVADPPVTTGPRVTLYVSLDTKPDSLITSGSYCHGDLGDLGRAANRTVTDAMTLSVCRDPSASLETRDPLESLASL